MLLDCNLVRRHQFGDQSAQYEKCHRVKQHDHVILADTGEVLGVLRPPRIQQIKATLEEIFDIEVMHHSLNIYARKRATTQCASMKVDVLLGLQWGDEGKGKIVDVLTPEYDIIARFQGGPNAGHTPWSLMASSTCFTPSPAGSFAPTP